MARTRMGDPERLAAVDVVLRELAAGRPLPHVTLTDSADSVAVPSVFGRRARMWVSRGTVAAGIDALRGEVAHEYAHLIDPDHWRDAALAMAGWAAAAGVYFGSLAVPMLLPTLRPELGQILAVLALWIVGWLALGCGCWWCARITHRRELRADRIAAQLLGSTGPVLTMLDRVSTEHAKAPRWRRAFARLTHPDPALRRQALVTSPTGGR